MTFGLEFFGVALTFGIESATLFEWLNEWIALFRSQGLKHSAANRKKMFLGTVDDVRLLNSLLTFLVMTEIREKSSEITD